ncbi:MAG: GHKL domain-containing protein [Mobilitalea sp.]
MLAYIQTYYIEMKYGMAFIITQISFVVFGILLLNDLTFSLKAIIKKAAEILLWLVGFIIFNIYYSKILDENFLYLIPYGLFIFFYAKFASKYSASTRILRSFLYGSSFILILSISKSFGVIRETVNIEFIQNMDLTSITSVLGFIFITFFLHKFSTESFRYVPNFSILLMVAISIFSCLTHFTFTNFIYDTGLKTEAYNALMCIIFWILEMMAYYMCYSVASEYSQNVDLMAMQHKAEVDKEVYRFSKQNYEEMSSLRHEIKNHKAYMLSLLQNRDYVKLEEYFQESVVETSDLFQFIDCGNVVINNIINYEITKAKAYGVTIETKIAVPEELPFRETDICSLLSNLLDNAIEACTRQNKRDKIIQFKIWQDNHYLFIKVENPIDDIISKKERLSLKTTKLNSSTHGYGTKVIHMIVERYKGYVKYKIHEEHFVADVMLLSVLKTDNSKKI